MTSGVLPNLMHLGRPKFRSIPTWLPVLGFVVMIAVLLLAGRAQLVRFAYPVGALAVGWWLYCRGPGPFLAFGWLLWHVSPGLRRIVDYQLGGWEAQNPMSLAPFLVSAIAALGVARRLPELRRPRFLPWSIAIICLLYGYFVGVLRLGVLPATHALVSWLVPLLFGLYCAVEWRRYPEYQPAVRKAFLLGSLALGIYGVFQFVDPPAWDRLWMVDSGMYSVGRAFPYEVRVFSLVNAPLPFATILVAGLFISLSGKGPGRIISLVVGSLALLLSLVRSVWLAGTIGFIVYLASLPLRSVRRVMVMGTVTLAGLTLVPLAFPPDIAKPTVEIVKERFLTFGQLKHDVSFQDRAQFLDNITDVVTENPLGQGLGSTGVSSTLGDAGNGIRDFDNGVFAVLYSLGWFAGAALLLSVLWVIAQSFRRLEPGDDLMAKTARGVAVTSLVLIIGANVLEGVSGAVLWGFAGLLTAAHQYHTAEAAEAEALRCT